MSWMIQTVNHADGSHFPSIVFSISGGSSRTALAALDGASSCSLFRLGCSRHPSIARRDAAERDPFSVRPLPVLFFSCSEGSFHSILEYVVVFVMLFGWTQPLRTLYKTAQVTAVLEIYCLLGRSTPFILLNQLSELSHLTVQQRVDVLFTLQ